MSETDKLKKLKHLLEKDVPYEFYVDHQIKYHDEGSNPEPFRIKVEGNKLVLEKGSGFGTENREDLLNKINNEIEKEGLGLKLKQKGNISGNKWELEFE